MARALSTEHWIRSEVLLGSPGRKITCDLASSSSEIASSSSETAPRGTHEICSISKTTSYGARELLRESTTTARVNLWI